MTHDQALFDSKMSKFSYYENYLGVDIDQDDQHGYYVACVWDWTRNKNRELISHDIEDIRFDLNHILAQNYFECLNQIAGHFEHVKDFNNPEQNLENLRERIGEIIIKLGKQI
jgi:hypothetical protein